MGGFFIRPKSSTVDDEKGLIHVEPIGVVQEFEDEYIPTSGFDPSTDGISGGRHNKDPKRREAAPGAPLPTGGQPRGYTGTGGRSWRGSVSKNVSSGFGRGTRAGKAGVRR